MDSGKDRLAVLVGMSAQVDRLRRRLRRRGFANVGVSNCVAGLRRELVSGGHDLVLSCMLLDDATLSEHGESLRQLQADAEGYAASWRCVGLVPDQELLPQAARLGCHCYVSDETRVISTLDRLVMHWTQRTGVHESSASPVISEPRRLWPLADRFGGADEWPDP